MLNEVKLMVFISWRTQLCWTKWSLLLWGAQRLYYYYLFGFVLFLWFLFCFCEERSDAIITEHSVLWRAKRDCFCSAFVERSDLIIITRFCGAKRPVAFVVFVERSDLIIDIRFCGAKRPVVFVLVLGFYYHKERSCGFKVFICM